MSCPWKIRVKFCILPKVKHNRQDRQISRKTHETANSNVINYVSETPRHQYEKIFSSLSTKTSKLQNLCNLSVWCGSEILNKFGGNQLVSIAKVSKDSFQKKSQK